MSNKWLVALFVVGAIAVGTVALKNNSKESVSNEIPMYPTDLVETTSPEMDDVATNSPDAPAPLDRVAATEVVAVQEATAEVAK